MKKLFYLTFIFVVFLGTYTSQVHAEDPASTPSASGTAPASDIPLDAGTAPTVIKEPTITPTPTPSATETATPRPIPAKSTPKPKPVSTSPITGVVDQSALLPSTNEAPLGSNANLLIVLGAGIAGVLGGVLVFLKTKKNKKNNPCQEIKDELEAKKNELKTATGQISLQEKVIAELKKKAEDKKDELKDKAVNKAKEITKKKILRLEEESLANKSINLTESAVGTYNTITEKIEQVKDLIEALKSKQQGLTTEIQKLESDYKVCMVGATSSTVVGGGKIFNPLITDKSNCIIIHGCPRDKEKAMNSETRTYDKHWIPWIKHQLSSRDINTEIPLMPSPWEPNYEDFKKEFEKYKVSENTILIGHSCGCAFLVRWLGESKQKIKKLILVAPWKIPDINDSIRENFYVYPIDETIKSRVKDIVMFTSDNEEEDGKKSLEIYHQSLGGKIIELKGRGHYVLEHMGTEEFPELLQEII